MNILQIVEERAKTIKKLKLKQKEQEQELNSLKNEVIKMTDQDVIDSLYSLGEDSVINEQQSHK